MPLIRRVPKFGFNNPSRVEFQIVNVSTLETLIAGGRLTAGKITPETLYAAGAISKKSMPVKILAHGDLKSKIEITANGFSKSALQKIEASGGKAITISSVHT